MEKITGIFATLMIVAMTFLALTKLDLHVVAETILMFLVPILGLGIIISIVNPKKKGE